MESSLRLPEKAQETTGFPWQALGASLALHALVLGTLGSLADFPSASALPGQVLSAILQPADPPAIPAAVPSAPTFEARPPQPRKAIPPPSPPSATVAPMPPERLQAETSAADEVRFAGRTESSTASLQANSSPAGEAGGAAVQRATAAPAAGAISAASDAHGPDAAGLRQYRLALAGEARRYRRYPEVARRTGLSGTAEVRVVVAASGKVRQTVLSRSSGHAALDEVAQEILRLAAERAELPASLRGQDFAVLLPVVFEVEQ